MLHKPKFKPRYRVETVESAEVFFLSERDHFLLSDHLYQYLATLIDGQRTVEEILEAIQLHLLQEQKSGILPQDIFNITIKAQSALFQMQQQGYIVENTNSLPPNLAVFCDHLHIAPQEALQRLQGTKVAVKSFGSVAVAEFITILESLQVQITEDADINIVLTDDYLCEELEKFNQQALQSKTPWMLVKPVGTIIWLGPIFYPGQTGCWQCLAQRLRNNRPFAEFIQRQKDVTAPLTPPLDTLPSAWQTALNMAATEVFKWIVRGDNRRLEGVIVTHDPITLENQNHFLVKRPQCPSCGKPDKFASKPLPIVLGSRKKTFTADGGHRYCLPKETLRKYQHHISPITGVVRELVKLHIASESLTHTYVAKHHFATIFDDLNSLKRNIGGRSGGKGKTDQQARASGFCEAIERYSGVFQGNEIRQKGSYQQMGETAIHPNTCMNFSQTQYANREEWNENCSGWFQKVPESFDEEQEIDWTPVWSLTKQEFKYLPTAYCYYGYSESSQPSCWADSNGCATGNTIEEAILQGFMELVERDGVALWWYNYLQRPRVDLDSFHEPYFQALQEYYQTLHRELWVLDITSDLGIPTFAAITRRTNREVEDIVLGYGAHFDPKIAISRALTETNQVLPAVLTVNDDGSTQYAPSADPLARKWWQTATIENQPYLVADESIALKVSADYPQLWSDDLLEDVITCQQIVEKQGMEMLVLEQTRPDIGLNVVKVIVPGLRHFWKRLGEGRLYEVPVKMGWLSEPKQEEQLNPFPMWM